MISGFFMDDNFILNLPSMFSGFFMDGRSGCLSCCRPGEERKSGYFSSQVRKSSTRERLTVISKVGDGRAEMRSLPPPCLMMLVMAFMFTMHPLEILKNCCGFSSSLMTSRDESIMNLCSSNVTSQLVFSSEYIYAMFPVSRGTILSLKRMM